jgi:hypothetical protein
MYFFIFIFFIPLFLISSTIAKTYYVDCINGLDTHLGTSLLESWKTVTKANQTLVAGDTLLIKGGIYSNSISPLNNGNKQQPIIYRNYETEDVIFRELATAISIIGKSNIIVSGITAKYVDRYVLLENCNNVIVKNCHFDSANNTGGWPIGIVIHRNAHHNKIQDCIVGRVGYCTTNPSDDKGGLIVIGNWSDTSDHTDYNVLENNVFFYGGHHIIELIGKYNVIRNNYFHNEEWMSCSQTGGICGNCNLIVGYDPKQSCWNLIEGNKFSFAGLPPEWKYCCWSECSHAI